MLIIVGEIADDFDELRAALIEDHDPQSVLECELVERLAGILWRLRRVPFFEAAIMDARHTQAELQMSVLKYATGQPGQEECEEDADWRKSVHFGFALINDAHFNDALGKLGRHEATLMNALTKTLHMLMVFQDNRSTTRGEPTMLEEVALRTAA